MGLFDRLFGGGKNQQAAAPGLVTGEVAMKIVNAYGGAMESGPVPGTVADVQSLPYPKIQIKEALRYAMSVTTDKRMREHLVQGYVALADYQEGVGPRPIGIDATKADLSGDIRATAAAIAAQGTAYEKWRPIVEAEIRASLADLRMRGMLDVLD